MVIYPTNEGTFFYAVVVFGANKRWIEAQLLLLLLQSVWLCVCSLHGLARPEKEGGNIIPLNEGRLFGGLDWLHLPITVT